MYRIPCSCGQVYIGKAIKRLETRMKEHQDACKKGTLSKSAVAEHTWERHHTIRWEETAVLTQVRRHEELILNWFSTSTWYLLEIVSTVTLE